MQILRVLFWSAVAVGVLVGGRLLLTPSPPQPPVARWQLEAEAGDPVIVGDASDPFVYAGGEAIRAVLGSGTVRLDAEGQGSIRLTVEAPSPDAPLSLQDGFILGESWTLIAEFDASSPVWIDAVVHGDTGVGDERLPETMARYAGSTVFELRVDSNRQIEGLNGFWSIADALRRDDGSIGQQGLVFSPLLRDKTGFADRDRLELTLLLYVDSPGGDVFLHLVWRDIRVTDPAGPAPGG